MVAEGEKLVDAVAAGVVFALFAAAGALTRSRITGLRFS